jgi:PleD family two-component response regulator
MANMTNELDLVGVAVTNWMLAAGSGLGEGADAGSLTTNRPLRSVVVVSGRTPRADSLTALLAAASNYDVIFVESIANCYSCITRVLPDLIIVPFEGDDVATCQLLSMLSADRRSSRIPVLTCPTFSAEHDLYDAFDVQDQEASAQSLAAPMN